jgi:hypothetical protein
MKKIIVLAIIASFAGSVMAKVSSNPVASAIVLPQDDNGKDKDKGKHEGDKDKDKDKDKDHHKHHRHHHEHKPGTEKK